MTGVSNDLEQYLLNHTTPLDGVLQELIRHTHLTAFNPRMLSGVTQGKLLEFICLMLKPQRVLEIGTFTGFATICMAKALPEGAVLDTIELNDELQGTIAAFLHRAGVAHRVNTHFGDAGEIIPSLKTPYDLVFIDGDKREYAKHYALVFPLVKKGGYIVADNVLWNGKVFDESATDAQTVAIRNFNSAVQSDARVDNVLLPLRDGLMLIRKL